MAAGGLTYSGLTNFGKATLPSVDSWGTNMNILRDPHRSITTRKIDKVGQTSDITQMIDESGDRACGTIMQYSRGINPMVSVSYQNAGRSSAGITSNFGNGQQAYPPYVVMPQGSFRPPVLRQEDLFPLSRLPRTWTYAFTNPEMPDYTKKVLCQGSAFDYRAVHNNILKGSIRPTAVYKLEQPIQENYEVKYVIQNPLHVTANSAIKAEYTTTLNFDQDITKGIVENPLHGEYNTNISSIKYFNNSELDTDRYIQSTNHSDITTNISKPMQTTCITDLIDLDINDKIKTKLNVNYQTSQASSNIGSNYIHDEIELEPKMPAVSASTNHVSDRLSTNDEFKYKTVVLPPKPQYGGFIALPVQPTMSRVNNQPDEYETEKAIMSRKVMETMQGRFKK
jgi:hypothetical protein